MRSYGTEPVVWSSETECDHEWINKDWYRNGGGRAAGGNFIEAGEANAANIKESRWMVDSTCARCGAWRGELGLEPTPEIYVAHLVEIFRELKRVLRADGTLWLNLGDSYMANRGNTPERPGYDNKAAGNGADLYYPGKKNIPGYKTKDLVGIPWMVAFALRADGWYLRSEITWCKNAPMPESVRDRPTTATEKIFLLTKSERYVYNQDAVRTPTAQSTVERYKSGWAGNEYRDHPSGHHNNFSRFMGSQAAHENAEKGANLRNYWRLNPDPFRHAHFATFPREIPKRCILLGSNPGDVVLDPFSGSGTTAKVAIELGRKAVAIEPKAEYIEMIKRRCQTTIGLPLAI